MSNAPPPDWDSPTGSINANIAGLFLAGYLAIFVAIVLMI